MFGTHCQSYLDECTAVLERRHDTVSYMVKGISVRCLVGEPSTPVTAAERVRITGWFK